jgi:CheY-like chemotaxis protein
MNPSRKSIPPARLSGPPPEGDKTPGPPKRSLHILSIDDDKQILEMMSAFLTHFGHRVEVAAGGRQGIELFHAAILNREPFDVVTTDLGMPEINGCQVARAIKAESPKTPVILLTGEAAVSREGGAGVEAVDFVVCKPPRMQELNDLLHRLAG